MSWDTPVRRLGLLGGFALLKGSRRPPETRGRDRVDEASGGVLSGERSSELDFGPRRTSLRRRPFRHAGSGRSFFGVSAKTFREERGAPDMRWCCSTAVGACEPR